MTAFAPGERGKIDNAGLSRFFQPRHGGARDPQHRRDVHVDDPLPKRGVHFLNRTPLDEIAGVVYQYVESAQKLGGISYKLGGFGFVRQVGAEYFSAATAFFSQRLQFTRPGFAGEIVDGHVRIRGEEVFHDAVTESLSATSDKRTFSVEISHGRYLLEQLFSLNPFVIPEQ